MVKLSLPTWDRDKSQFQAGTSFTPSLAGRLKSSPSASSTSSVLRRLKSPDPATSSQSSTNPLMTLRLSSPSFLDSVVHDGSSENPLYVIDTDDNVTKVRRSDPKGFVNVSRVRWPTNLHKSSFRKNKDLTGVEVVFGKGHWKPADEFLGYGSLSSYRKFYIPHHRHSLRWKRSGVHYACTTETVKGPVAVLEPAMQRAPPQLKILDPLFRLGSSKPQRMHNGLPLSLLDFLLVTAMLLVTPSEEWMNVTRTSPSDSFLDDGSPSDLSLGVLSSNGLPSSSSLSSGTPDIAALLHTSEATPEIDRWRSSIPARAKDDNHSHYAESIDGGAASEASSRATSRLSSHTDNHAAVQHSAYTPGQGVYATHSGSSLSLASHAPPSSRQPNRRTRELPRLPPSQGYSYTRGAPSTSHRRVSQDEPPPLPPLPTSAHTSLQDRPSPISPVSVPPRRTPASPTSSIHSRSLPVPPTPSSAKPPIPPLPIMPSRSSPASPDPGPGSSTPPHPPPPRSRSYTHLRSVSSFPEAQNGYDSPIKLPPNYSASTHELFPSPAPVRDPTEHGGVGRSLSIRTTNISHGSGVVRARSASIRVTSSRSGLASGDGDPFDLPPAYTAIDMSRSPLRVNGDPGVGGE
ncbi:hypothetical protein EDB86DRAFT_1182533 [Lactarius hatsudake]|nr:hypothetical protein EDB86DRAFT_1182533 [Lactarius hatsudake]